MFKYRYFINSSFMEAQCPRTASFTWKSIFWGRELLKEGLRWRIGTGERVRIYEDKWLPSENSFKVHSRQVFDAAVTVNSLINVQGSWNIGLINASFSSSEAASILSIPLARTRQEDVLRWHYDAKGVYTVRSGYHLAMNNKNEASQSDLSDSLRWWKYFWKVAIPTKIKIFLWKGFHNWTPARLNLQRRGMCLDISCPSCGRDVESMVHVMWFCKEAQVVWKEWSASWVLKPETNWQMQDLLVHAYTELNKEDFAIFGTLLWLIWHNRNVRLFGGEEKPKGKLVQWAVSYIDEFKDANVNLNDANRGVGRVQTLESDKRWVPPRRGVFAVNVDAGFAGSQFTTGVVIRDWRGEVIAAECRRYEGRMQVCTGEALAIRDGITLATETNLTPFVINSDSKVVVDSFNNNSWLGNDVGLIVQDCFDVLNDSSCVGFVFAPRQSNVVAHMLAKKAHVESSNWSRWMGNVPPDIIRYVMADQSALI